MFYGFGLLMKHMEDEHPNSKWYGDSVWGTLDGQTISQICQICGKELVSHNIKLPHVIGDDNPVTGEPIE